ncbi:mediator of RNA polymerase II transcription subunit 13 [Cladophialophora chaetospira]|uniref:Mediator of RNA polymerase II transcription subunit 13 n=1 Tax=Cladophialophora chaetospira TaxID=386627 RepID=A0AA38XIH2_9EURO|nr:mediator of RNA polymerase II transcription subunit 13 [Cladophialophora chaetospira]
MSTTLDFPSNCPTNVYTLNDFGEIAYIVCTAAAPPTHDPSAFVASPENILARLRKTERQFRDNSILAALDVDARQLFTFYKKVDITAPKDQKALLLKFGYVLRSNSCTIAYKTAARLPDLMKPEQARLYRLFITAIVSSIKLMPAGDNALQRVGPNLYLVENAAATTEQNPFPQAQKWTLYRIDLQVVLSGYIILTIAKDDKLSFLPVHTYPFELDGQAHTSDVTAVYLAPIGRIARASRSRLSSQTTIGNHTSGKHNAQSQIDTARREVWKVLLPLWLREHMNIAIQLSDVPWVEVEVGLEEFDPGTNEIKPDTAGSESGHGDSIMWRTIFWPANLCFLLSTHEADHDGIVDINDDPMQFVRDWILGTGSAASKSDLGLDVVMEDDDEPLFAEDGTFDDPEHFQPFGPPAFPASQTIYPTPPDVGMTHPTPGLSSVDGIGMTPANLPGSSAELAQQQDEDMPDFEDVPPASGISSYYDEDLFEEMPDDNFGQGANGDEPNWDFFDGPGAQSKASRSASHGRREGTSSRGDPKQDRAEPIEGQDQHSRLSQRLLSTKKEMSTPGGMLKVPIPDEAQPTSTQVAPNSIMVQPKEKGMTPSPPRPAPPLWQNNSNETPASEPKTRRRSSVFDGANPLPSIPKHDRRYDAEGDFWFDPSPILTKTKLQPKPIPVSRRPPSSPSGSDSSMSSSGQSYGSLSGDAPALFRQWTQYSPESHDIGHNETEVDKKSIQQDVQQILSLLKPGLVDSPTVSDFMLDEGDAANEPPSASQKTQHIAQVLVDQMSQTSLIYHGEHQCARAMLGDDRFDMHIDLTGINTSATPSNLSQLLSLKADHNGARLHGRVTKLLPSQISLKRVERPLMASMAILKFWDTLNLQPVNGQKDLTAFCVHPGPDNVREGSLNLLHRLADSYTTCALGTHTIGHLPDLMEDGLISWVPDGALEHSLLRTTSAIGSALATTSSITGTVVVYMISRGETSAAYLEMCIAFYNLFESFTKARTDISHVSDIQLQVIPRSFIASPETLAIPPQTAYLKLAVEVYNRLPPLDFTGPPAACGSAVLLARSERSVHLQLSPMYGSPLEKNGPCLHLAYSVSQDNKWLTAVWTDELGRMALSMSYCSHLRESSKRRPRHEIFQEMWEVSQDLMSKVRGPWRLAVVKTGFYDTAEPNEWHRIFDSSPTSQKRCLLLLLSIQLHSALTIFPPVAQGKAAQGGAHNQYGTPASTPQASMTSPDQIVPATPTPGGSTFMNASTPPDPPFDPSTETDLLVVDPSDESWAVILPYGLNQSRSMTELRPSQVTALLVKRRGLKVEDGYTMIEISLLRPTSHAANKPTEVPSDDLLDDLIRQYRGLVILGATRGCVDPNRECLPWHIATAIRGARILEQAM